MLAALMVLLKKEYLSTNLFYPSPKFPIIILPTNMVLEFHPFIWNSLFRSQHIATYSNLDPNKPPLIQV